MVKYDLPEVYYCWKCDTEGTPTASLNNDSASWLCNNCQELNIVIINLINFRVGQRLLLAAQRLLHNNEVDLAAVLLYSAVDASLSRGIIELDNWRKIEKLQPTAENEIEHKLKSKRMKDKVKWYLKLAGATIDDEITRLSDNESFKEAFSDITFDMLHDKFILLANERHKLIHFGEDVDEKVVRSSIVWVNRIIIILDSLWNAAFKNRRNRNNNMNIK